MLGINAPRARKRSSDRTTMALRIRTVTFFFCTDVSMLDREGGENKEKHTIENLPQKRHLRFASRG